MDSTQNRSEIDAIKGFNNNNKSLGISSNLKR